MNVLHILYNLSVLYRIIKINKGKSNLSRYEYAALNKLKRNENIVIKKADKNSGIVVMNASDYEIKVNSMLTDVNVYTPVEDLINMVFWTGADREPPCGFGGQLRVDFYDRDENESRRLPSASTCSLTLWLPRNVVVVICSSFSAHL